MASDRSPKHSCSSSSRIVKTAVYSFSDYRSFLGEALDLRNKGNGRLARLAAFLKVHPSRLSRILKGPDHATSEQAFLMAQFLGLSLPEKSYFVCLVNLERAATPSYRAHLQQEMEEIRAQNLLASPMLAPDKKLRYCDEQLFFSSYVYQAVWLMSAIPGCGDPRYMAKKLKIDEESIAQIAKFLVAVELCRWDGSILAVGPRSIRLESDSPFLETFLQNWRLRSVEIVSSRKPSDFFHSEAMAVGSGVAERVKELLKETVAQIREMLKEAPADDGKCLNIDWFQF